MDSEQALKFSRDRSFDGLQLCLVSWTSFSLMPHILPKGSPVLKAFLILLTMNGSKLQRYTRFFQKNYSSSLFLFTPSKPVNESFLCSTCNKDFTEYTNFEECLAFIEDNMIKSGPFDGFLGFSQVGFV